MVCLFRDCWGKTSKSLLSPRAGVLLLGLHALAARGRARIRRCACVPSLHEEARSPLTGLGCKVVGVPRPPPLLGPVGTDFVKFLRAGGRASTRRAWGLGSSGPWAAAVRAVRSPWAAGPRGVREWAAAAWRPCAPACLRSRVRLLRGDDDGVAVSSVCLRVPLLPPRWFLPVQASADSSLVRCAAAGTERRGVAGGRGAAAV